MPTDNEYLKSYEDFLKDSSLENQVEEALEYLKYVLYEERAAQLEVTVDYYIQEFV